jgi:PAS domain S-box-containing protein
MARKPTYEEMEQRIRVLEEEPAKGKRVENALQVSELRFKAQYQGSPTPTFTWQKREDDFVLVDSNQAAEAITNGRVKEFTGRKAKELYGKRQYILQDLQRCFVEKEKITRELASEDFLPGRSIFVTLAFVPPDLVMVHLEDITERKRAEEALRESEEKYRTLFETSQDANYITTPEGKIIEANQSHLDLFGYTKEERFGFRVAETYVNPDDRLRFRKEIEEKGAVKNFEVTLRKMDGTEIDCLITATVRRSKEGGILGYQGIIRDVTERKRAEEALEEERRRLQKALEDVRTLRGIVPICASCKKIRDDKGYWNQVEKYVSEHSEAEFSHGICPECLKKFYPEFAQDESQAKP